MKWQDFDFDGKVKIPWGFYLVMVYLLRGYITWVISLTYRDDPGLLLSLVYAERSFFYMSMVVGLPAVFVQFLFALKKQTDKPWYQGLWSKSYTVLLLALFADLILQINQVITLGGLVHGFNMITLLLGGYLAWYWMSSSKLKRFFVNWLS